MLLRIHHITDQAYHGAGILLDNIRIAAIDFTDDAEAASDYWTVAGFVRSTNIVPQQWSVQAVLFDKDGEGNSVTPLSLDTTDTGVTGALQVSTDEIERLILVIAPMTSTQGQPAPATIQARFTSSSPFDTDLPLELDFP